MTGCSFVTTKIISKPKQVMQHQVVETADVLNLGYEDIDGEFWKELPYLEGCYHISNLGRIKSLDRIIASKDGKNRFYKGKILKGVVVRYLNKTCLLYTSRCV